MTVVRRGTYCGSVRKEIAESVHTSNPEFLHQSQKRSRGRVFVRRPSSNRSSFMMRMTTLVCCILFQRQLLYRQQQHFFVGASYTIEIGPNSEECFIFRTPTTIPKGAPSVLMYVVPTAAPVVFLLLILLLLLYYQDNITLSILVLSDVVNIFPPIVSLLLFLEGKIQTEGIPFDFCTERTKPHNCIFLLHSCVFN